MTMLFDPAADTWTPDKLVRRAPAQPVVPRALVDPNAHERRRLEIERRKEERRQREDAILAEAQRITEERLSELQRKAQEAGRSNKSRAANIVEQVAIEYGVTVHDINGPWRAIKLWRARQAAYYRIRTETTLSYPAIGRLIGDRDWTTVMHGVRKHALRHNLPLPGGAR